MIATTPSAVNAGAGSSIAVRSHSSTAPMAFFLDRYEAISLERRARRKRARERRKERALERRLWAQSLPIEERKAVLAEMNARMASRHFDPTRGIELRAAVRRRLEVGYEHTDIGQRVLGRTRDDFVEAGLRSIEFGRTGRLFVAGCRKANGLRGGMDKAVVDNLGPSKLLALDAPYIEVNRSMLSAIRIDLDAVFPSIDHAESAIRQVVADGGLPVMPHLMCGDTIGMELEGGWHPEAFVRPHLWVLLPYGSAVCFTPAGRAQPKRLLAAVYRGLCRALLHLGADPNASVLLGRGKNPLSPYLSTALLNDSAWPSLTDWAGWLDTRTDTETLVRMAAEVQSKADTASSNVAFTAWQKAAYDTLRVAHLSDEPDYVQTIESRDRVLLADWLRWKLPLRALDTTGLSRDAADRILGKVIDYAASRWDPDMVRGRAAARGAMRHLTVGMTAAQARTASAARSSAMKAEHNIAAIQRAVDAIAGEGYRPTKAEVSRRSGVHRNVVAKRWNEIQHPEPLRCTVRCVDKKQGSPTAILKAVAAPTVATEAMPADRSADGTQLPTNPSGGFVRPIFLLDRRSATRRR